MALPLPRAPCLLLLLVVMVAAAQSPISQPPSPGAPTASPLLRPDDDSDNDNGSAASPVPASSPPAPTDPSPAEAASSAHSAATSSPAPANDYNKKKKEKAPAAMEVKAGSGSTEEQPQKAKRRGEMSGGRKAGVFHHNYNVVRPEGLYFRLEDGRSTTPRRSSNPPFTAVATKEPSPPEEQPKKKGWKGKHLKYQTTKQLATV